MKNVIRILRQAHLYLALLFSLPILVVSLTGIILVVKPTLLAASLYWGEQVPESELEEGAIMVGLDKIERQWSPHNIAYLRVPDKQSPYWLVFLKDNQRYYLHSHSYKQLHDSLGVGTILTMLTELHTQLLLGLGGKIILLFTATSLFFLALSGVYLWWPQRRQYRSKWVVQALVADRRHVRFRIKQHKHLGIVVMVLIAMSSLTGATMMTQKVLRALATQAEKPIDASQLNHNLNFTTAALLPVVYGALPNAKATYIWPASRLGDSAKFRLRFEDEWHVNGKSSVTINVTSGHITNISNSREAKASDRLLNLMYPLHSGYGMSALYLFMIALTGFGLFHLTRTGCLHWLRQKRRRQSN